MTQTIQRSLVGVAVSMATGAAVTVSGAAQAQNMTMEQARKQIAPFYEMLNAPATKDLKALAEQALAPD